MSQEIIDLTGDSSEDSDTNDSISNHNEVVDLTGDTTDSDNEVKVKVEPVAVVTPKCRTREVLTTPQKDTFHSKLFSVKPCDKDDIVLLYQDKKNFKTKVDNTLKRKYSYTDESSKVDLFKVKKK